MLVVHFIAFVHFYVDINTTPIVMMTMTVTTSMTMTMAMTTNNSVDSTLADDDDDNNDYDEMMLLMFNEVSVYGSCLNCEQFMNSKQQN